MIIFDLDGTLANCDHRRHFVDKRLSKDHSYGLVYDPKKPFKPDWQSFYEACDKDTPIIPVIHTLEYFGEGKEYGSDTPWVDYNGIEIWSGRCESVKEKTEKWLSKHLRYYYPGSPILKMRPIGNTEPDEVLKERWLDEAIAEGKTIDFVFDDRKKVCDMWRRRGIFLFNVNQTGEVF